MCPNFTDMAVCSAASFLANSSSSVMPGGKIFFQEQEGSIRLSLNNPLKVSFEMPAIEKVKTVLNIESYFKLVHIINESQKFSNDCCNSSGRSG